MYLYLDVLYVGGLFKVSAGTCEKGFCLPGKVTFLSICSWLLIKTHTSFQAPSVPIYKYLLCIFCPFSPLPHLLHYASSQVCLLPDSHSFFMLVQGTAPSLSFSILTQMSLALSSLPFLSAMDFFRCLQIFYHSLSSTIKTFLSNHRVVISVVYLLHPHSKHL